jgi:hypothetical protein
MCKDLERAGPNLLKTISQRFPSTTQGKSPKFGQLFAADIMRLDEVPHEYKNSVNLSISN